MSCGCGGKKATTSTVYVLTASGGQRTEHATKVDAEYANTLGGGGGSITPVRK